MIIEFETGEISYVVNDDDLGVAFTLSDIYKGEYYLVVILGPKDQVELANEVIVIDQPKPLEIKQ